MSTTPAANLPWVSMTLTVYFVIGTAGVIDTGGTFAASVNHTVGKYAATVNNTGDK